MIIPARLPPRDDPLQPIGREDAVARLHHAPIGVEVPPHHHGGELPVGRQLAVSRGDGGFGVGAHEEADEDGELGDLLEEGPGLLAAGLLVDGEEAALGLGVVEENRGIQRLVVAEAEELLVGDVGGEARGGEEVRGGEVLPRVGVDAENGVVESALRVSSARCADAENAVVVQAARAVPRQQRAQQRRHREAAVVQEKQIRHCARSEVLLLHVHVPHRDEVLQQRVDQRVALHVRHRIMQSAPTSSSLEIVISL